MLWTVGHSTLPLQDFLALLKIHDVESLADIRRYPVSRWHPHFSVQNLAPAVAESGIEYRHYEALGGRRDPRPDSRNTLWRHPSFRGYADYMETPPFMSAFLNLEQVAGQKRTAFMCSERDWWKCHRQLVADAFTARGVEVRHIMGMGEAATHRLTKGARVEEGRVIYAGDENLLL